MKGYIKPRMNFITLSIEERFAGSACTVAGSCPEGTKTIVVGGTTYEVNNNPS